MGHGSAPINRDQYKVAQELIRSGAWHVDLDQGRIWSNRRQDWIGAVRKRSGYVYLTTPGAAGKQFYVVAHRVIWESRLGVIPDDRQINHINGVKHDNRIVNLELTTSSSNILHAFNIGLRRPTSGVTNGMAKLTNLQVMEIRSLLANGALQDEVSAAFGITQSAVSSIKRGRLWSHLSGAVQVPRQRRMTPDEVQEVLALLERGWTQQRVAAKFGIVQSAVSRIKRVKGGG